MRKVIIAGGRDFDDCSYLCDKVNELLCEFDDGEGYYALKESVEIVSGKAKGADKLGERWAKGWGLEIKEFPADWDKHGKSAGYKRNKEMAEYADMLIAFWNGESRGTKHMIDLALEHGLEVHVFRYE